MFQSPRSWPLPPIFHNCFTFSFFQKNLWRWWWWILQDCDLAALLRVVNWTSQQGFLTSLSHSNFISQPYLSLTETWSTIVAGTIQWALTTILLHFWGHQFKYQQRNYVHRLLVWLTIVTPPTPHSFSLLLESEPTVVTYPRFCLHILLPTLLTPLLSRKLPPQGPSISRCQ
jgi:hypothetical protein